MIKRLAIVALLLLALHFIAVAGGVGYLFATGKIDADRARAIGKIVFPDAPPASQPATQPVGPTASSDPLFQIDALLERQAGKTAAEQVQVVRDAYESFAAQLDRQRREILDLRRQVDAAQAQVIADRASIAAREEAFAARVATRTRQNTDAGFRQTMQVLEEMTTRQVKDMFANMEDATVVRYLQGMEPRRVSRVVNEFTSPEEKDRARRLLDLMRTNADDGDEPQDAGSAPTGTTAARRPSPSPTPAPPTPAR